MKQRALKVLVCEDDKLHQRTLQLTLGNDFELFFVEDGEGLLRQLHTVRPDAIVLDVGLKAERDGFIFLPKLRVLYPEAPVIVHSGATEYAWVVEAIRLGATDYVAKDCPPEELKQQLYHVIAQHQAKLLGPVVAAGTHPDQFVGSSDSAFALRQTIERIGNFDGNIIINGEPGVGKEVVARMLRRRNCRGQLEPWVDIDSSTIQGSMAESILFGHERGAFTGADKERKGLFEQATGGSVYFDEIGNMSLEVQAKLLRVLQEKRMTRLGSTKTISLDFRVIAATNGDLAAMCRRGEFRFDLYSRLDAFTVEIPPLRQRRDDVPLLIQYFLTKRGAGDLSVSDQAMQRLINYDWPGNVRELFNVVRYMLVMSNNQPIDRTHLPSKVLSHCPQPEPIDTKGWGFRDQVKQFEKQLLTRGMQRAGGNVAELARELKMDRSSLYTRLAEHGLKRPASDRNDAGKSAPPPQDLS